MNSQIEFEETVSYLLAKVATAYRNSLERKMVLIELHAGQVFVLIELWKKDGQRQIELAKKLNLSAPTVNKTLGGLFLKGYVRAESDPKDKRTSCVFLTDEGRKIREKIETQWIEVEESCLKGLREPERVVLFDLLSRLRNAFTGRETSEEE